MTSNSNSGDNKNNVKVIELETTPLLGSRTKNANSRSGNGHHASSSDDPKTAAESPPPLAIQATAALASAMLVQSYLLVGVFPYSGFLAMHLVPSLNEESAGRYAGLIASSFMAGRTLTSFHWGRAADRYGRTFTIKVSLLLSAFFSVLFGLAPSLPLALAARFALGLSNGIVGSVKTLIMEMSHGNKSKETKTMAIVMGMWGYGFLINPAISGYLSDPVRQYPNSSIVEMLDEGLDLTATPFLLPNLAGCLFCILSCGCVNSFVEETLPKDKLEQFTLSNLVPSFCRSRTRAAIVRTVSSFGLFKHLHVTDAEVDTGGDDISIDGTQQDGHGSDGTTTNEGDGLPRWVSPSPSTTALTILSPHSMAVAKEVSQKQTSDIIVDDDQVSSNEKVKETATIKSLWSRPSTQKHLMMNWIYSFVVITVDETFPLYCMSKYSGLGVEEKIIGKLLSGAGMGYILIQYIMLTSLVDRYGFYKSMRIASFFSVPLVVLLPISLITNRNAAQGTLTWSTLVFVSIIYSIARACSSVVFSTLTMTTNRTVPAHQRAAMNGLGVLGGSVGKALGPAFAGLLFSESVGRIVPPLGSVVVWTIIACMGLGFFVQTLLLPEHVSVNNVHHVQKKKQNMPSCSTSSGSTEQLVSKENDTGATSMAKNGNDDRPPSF